MSDEPLPLFGYDPTIIPDIDFCQKDASVIESDVITNYESLFYLVTKINKTLGRADPVRLFLLSIIYQIVVQRSIVDSTGKENLIKYSHGANLDNLGAKWGVRGLRLQPTKAATTLRFSLSNPLTAESTIPLGTLAQSSSGIQFETTLEGTIMPGNVVIDLPAISVQEGSVANGLVVGQINRLVSWHSPFLVSVTNISTTSGGADVETDDHFRARIWMTPESFSCAGPYGAYEYWAASANPNISDVSAWSDAAHAGQVYIYFLMEGGRLPTPDECEQVYAVCNADRIRPLTDQVFVQPPTQKIFGGQIKYWIRTADEQFSNDIQTKVTQAFNDYRVWQTTSIGRDINPSKADQMIVEAGAKRIECSSGVIGSIAFAQIGTLQNVTNAASGTTTFSLGSALTNGYVVVGIVVSDPSATVTAMTFDGAAMVLIDSNFSGGKQTALFGKSVGNKAAGTYNVGWTITGTPANADYLVANVVAYNGVHQTTSIGAPAHGVSNTRSLSVTVTSAAGDMVVGVANCNGTLVPGLAQIERWRKNALGTPVSALYSDEPAGAATVAHSYSFEDGNTGLLVSAVALKPVSTTGTGSFEFTVVDERSVAVADSNFQLIYAGLEDE